VPITAENARELQSKGVKARLSRKFTPVITQAGTVTVPLFTDPAVAKGLARVHKQLNAVMDMMDEATHGKTVDCPHCTKPVDVGADAKELDALSRAYDRLFRAWMVLSGTPGSGQRKPIPTRQARSSYSDKPAPVPEPEPPSTGQ
jgi:hypothetical protein